MSLQPLDKSMRKKLERTHSRGTRHSRSCGTAAMKQLGVGESKSYERLNYRQKELRRTFRSHGRQLGDERCLRKKTQGVERLVEEIAYQHWHRMLFARFLAENDLLDVAGSRWLGSHDTRRMR